MLKSFWKGLRAIEIIIVLMLITMLIVVVYKRYDHFVCRSMQSEAKFCLQEILNAQLLYHSQHDNFATITKLTQDEKRVLLPQKFYEFSDAAVPGKDNFTVFATGKANTLVAGEIWSIDEGKKLLNLKSVCPEL